jgi:hypothetical protein
MLSQFATSVRLMISTSKASAEAMSKLSGTSRWTISLERSEEGDAEEGKISSFD